MNQDTPSAGFFTKLADAQKNVQIQLIVSIGKSSDDITVSVLPKFDNATDDALKLLRPLNLRGTAEQLDEKFPEIMIEPVQKAVMLHANTEEYAQQVKIAEANSQEKKDLEKKVKEKSDKLKKLTEPEEFTYEGSIGKKAVRLANDILEIDADNKLALKVLEDSKKPIGTNNLFA